MSTCELKHQQSAWPHLLLLSTLLTLTCEATQNWRSLQMPADVKVVQAMPLPTRQQLHSGVPAVAQVRPC